MKFISKRRSGTSRSKLSRNQALSIGTDTVTLVPDFGTTYRNRIFTPMTRVFP